ncbi:MAG: hypothetical protein ABIA04_10240 [Pseudomonadota bacterium]
MLFLNLIKNNRQKTKSVIGLVIPSNWDANNNITGVSILTDLEEEYIVNNQNTNLLNETNNKIKAKGLITPIGAGKSKINIIKYKLIRKFK